MYRYAQKYNYWGCAHSTCRYYEVTFPVKQVCQRWRVQKNWLRARARCGNTSVSQPMLTARSWTKRKSYVDCARRSIIAYSGNTSNHLQRAHSQELVELREDSGDKPGSSVLPTAKQPLSKQQLLPGKGQSRFHRTAQSISDWLMLLQILSARVCCP